MHPIYLVSFFSVLLLNGAICTFLMFSSSPFAFAVFDQLTNVVKKFSYEIVKEGGVVRSIQNHGIRDLPHRFKARYPDELGHRYYRKGRFISIYFDSNPYAMKMAESTLNQDSEVLRYTNLKARSPLDFVNTTREDRNPYIKRVKKMEREQAREHGERVEKHTEA